MVVASQYATDSLLNVGGPTLLLYHDPDVQFIVYESNGVPMGPVRRYVGKRDGALILKSPESVDVIFGELPEDILR